MFRSFIEKDFESFFVFDEKYFYLVKWRNLKQQTLIH